MITLPDELIQTKYFRVLQTGETTKYFDQYYSLTRYQWRISICEQEIGPLTVATYRRPNTIIGWIISIPFIIKKLYHSIKK